MSDSTRRDIELRIRAQDLSTADFKAVSAAVRELTAALDQQIAMASKAQITERELSATIKQLEQAGKSLTGVGGLIDYHKNLSGAVTASQANVEKATTTLAAYRASLDSTGNTTKSAETKLASLVRQLQTAETALANNKAALERTSAALAKSGIDVGNLAQAERDLATVADQVGPALTKLNAAQTSYATNARLAREETQRLKEEQKGAVIAAKQQADATELLRAKQATQANELRAVVSSVRQNYNSMYESNRTFNAQTKLLAQQRAKDEDQQARDAVNRVRQQQQGGVIGAAPTTGSAGETVDGTRIAGLHVGATSIRELIVLSHELVVGNFSRIPGSLMVLGERLNGLDSIFASIISHLPLIAAAAAVVVVAIEALNAAIKDDTALRHYNALLMSSGDGTKYSAEGLKNLQREIQGLGISWADAGKIIEQAIKTGLNQDRIKDFAQAARDLADIHPDKTIGDAFKSLTEDFSSGVVGIRKFNDEYHVFSAEQLKRIQDLYNERKGQEALALALDLTFKKLHDGAKDALSPAAAGARELSIAWNSLMDELGKTGAIQGVITLLTGTVTLLERAITNSVAAAKAFNEMGKSAAEALRRNSPFTPPAGSFDPYGPGPATPSGDSSREGKGFGSGATRFDNPRGLKIDSESLKELANLLTEASRTLPEGYRVEAISTERPGAIVKGTNTPSEHGFGRAIDVRIVDSNGREVPGSMGPGGPLYDALDKAMTAAAARAGQTIAVGTTFGKPDAGHYSLGGREAANNAARRGDTAGPFTPTQDDVAKGQQAVELAKQQLAITFNSNQALEREAELKKAIADAAIKTNDKDEQDKLVAIAMATYDTQRHQKELDFQSQLTNLRVSDGKNADAIALAGQQARAKALADAKTEFGVRLISYDELNKAEQKGQEEARKGYAQEEKFQNEKRAIVSGMAVLDRQNKLKDASELDKALEAVNDRYTAQTQLLEKISKDNVNPAHREEIELLKQKLEAMKQIAIAQATVNSYEAAAKEALTTRNDLTKTYANLVASGNMTIGEQEAKTKEAFDLMRPKILAAADALEKFIATDKTLSPEKVALYTAKIAELRSQAQYVDPLFKAIKDAAENSFATGMSNAFNTISEAVGGLIAKTKSWKDVLIATRDAAINFFAQLLKDIANAILKYELLKVASELFGVKDSGGGGFLASLFGSGEKSSTGTGNFGGGGAAAGVADQVATSTATSSSSSGGLFSWLASLFHGGGVAGRSTVPTRAVPASWFANAPRYHTGTVVGLAPDEQTAILKKGEEVLTQDNPRNIMNRGSDNSGGGNQGIAIRNVLVLDKDLIPSAMAGSQGERTTMAHVVKNAATIRQLVK